jgi:ligand-binding sensor domain-containing protein/signal transduction histidine kinase
MAIATSFSDFVDMSSARLNGTSSGFPDSALMFNFRSWQKKDGLPQSPVRALAQTRDGYLWFGSDGGIVRFDGLRFVTYGIHEGLTGRPVHNLLEDSRGTLWIGTTSDGLSRLSNGQITTVTPRDGLPSGSINTLAEDSDGRLWIGTSAGLVSWWNERLLPLPGAEEFKGSSIVALFKDRQNKMWAGVKGAGIFQFLNGKFVPILGDGVDGLLKDPHCLLADQAGRIWVGAGEDSVLRYDGRVWQRYRIPRNLAKPFVCTLAEQPDGTIWAGSAGGGLLQLKDGKFSAVPASSGLTDNQIESLLTDQDGKLWVGTDTGLNHLQLKNFFAFGQNEGLGFGAVQGLAEVAPGVVWAAKPNGSLYRWNGKNFIWLASAGTRPRDSQAGALLVTHDNYCWVATANDLLLYRDPIAAADEVEVIEPAKPGIISLAEDVKGVLWAGTIEGKIWRLREGKWQTQTNFVQTNAITAIAPDKDGSMWVGTDGNGLYRFENGDFHHIEKNAGMFNDSIRALYPDAQGTLWIGTAGGGLGRWRNGHMADFTTREGLPDNTISQILEDDAGRLWLGTGGGIVSISKGRLEGLATGETPALSPQLFGHKEGLLSAECTGGFCPAGLKTKSGLLWFSTEKGVVVVDPHIDTAAAHMPATVLEEVLVDGVPNRVFHGSGPLRIPPGKHRIEFHYTGFNFDTPELMRFRYRLERLEPAWTDAGARRTAFYDYLPPGKYRFNVEAGDNDGAWTSSGSGLELVVLQHFWQSWWFIALAGFGLLMSVGGGARLVEKRKLQRQLKYLEQQRGLERERTRIAQDLHDEMGAKLCRISFLSEHARQSDLLPDELQNQIVSISDASREVLHSLDEIVWAVNPKNDTLEHVASYVGQYALEYFQMTGIQCELDMPAKLPPHPLSSQVRHHLFLATHEAITNILKHSRATHAKISMASDGGEFEINIADDGHGFNGSTNKSNEAPVPAPGDGLNNMHKRLADIGGRCQIESTPGGTSVRFTISLDLLTKSVC